MGGDASSSSFFFFFIKFLYFSKKYKNLIKPPAKNLNAQIDVKIFFLNILNFISCLVHYYCDLIEET